MAAKIRVPFNNLSLIVHNYSSELLCAYNRVLESGIFLNGSETKKFESKLSYYFKRDVITTASGHDAILLSLQSFNLLPGDEILFPVNAYPTAFPISMTKAKIVPVDCDENGQIDIAKLQAKITKKTKVIVVVHLYGLVTDIKKIVTIAKKKDIYVLEDCAQAFGSRMENKLVGTFGDVACVSFYPTKILGAFGDGGAVITNNPLIAGYVRQAKTYGEDKRYNSLFLSGHSRIPEIQAAMLSIYLQDIDRLLKKRKKLFQYYVNSLKKMNMSDNIRILASHAKSDQACHLFVIEAKKRDELSKFLAKKNIQTLIHYPKPIHLIPAFKYLHYTEGDFPTAERLSKNILSLPFYADISKKNIDYIVSSIKEYYG